MTSLYLHVLEADREQLIAQLWEAGTTGITEEPSGMRAFFAKDCDIATLLLEFADYSPQLQQEEIRDWEAESRAWWPSVEVGQLFFLAPEWNTDPTPPGRLRLTIFPGMAAGTGAHPCTQLCLRALERWVDPGMSLLDVGTGSGILLAAAHLLGCETLVGCDIDSDATVIARQNLSSMQPSALLFTGSLRSVHGAAVDALVANLNRATIRSLGPELLRVVKPAGLLVLSGFPEHESAAVQAIVGQSPCDRLHDSGWACLVFRDSV